MKHILGSFMVLIALYLLQTTLISKIAIAGIKPNVLILVVVTVAYRYGKIPGIMMGFLTGLFLDLSEGEYIGYYALIYLLIGYIIGFFDKVYNKDYHIFPIFLVAASDLIYNLMLYTFGFLLRNRLDFPYYLIRIILPEMFYTLILSVVLYKVLHLFYNILDRKKVEAKEDNSKGGSLN